IVELFGTPGGSFDLAVGLSRLLFPIVIMLALSGIIVGILNAYDHFTVPALTPVAWNLVIILGLVLGVPAASSEDTQLYIYAGLIIVSTLIGTLFASRLIDPDLAPRAIDLAFRLYMLPQGIFSVAVATVLF